MDFINLNNINNTISIFNITIPSIIKIKKKFIFGYSHVNRCFYKVTDGYDVKIWFAPNDVSAYEVGVLVNDKWQFFTWTEYTDLTDDKKLLKDIYTTNIVPESGKTNKVTIYGKMFRRAPEWIKWYWLKRLYTFLFKASEKCIDITFKRSINNIYGLPGTFINSLEDSWKQFEKEVLPKIIEGTY